MVSPLLGSIPKPPIQRADAQDGYKPPRVPTLTVAPLAAPLPEILEKFNCLTIQIWAVPVVLSGHPSFLLDFLDRLLGKPTYILARIL